MGEGCPVRHLTRTLALACLLLGSTSADGRLVALSPGHDIGAIVFPLEHPEQAIRVADGQDIRNLDVSPDGRFVITRPHTTRETHTSLWDAKTGELLLDLNQDPDDNQSPFWREWSRAHDLPPGTKPWQSILELRLAWGGERLPDQRLVFYCDGPGRICMEEIDTERPVVRLDAPVEEKYRAIAVSPDGGHVLATGNFDPSGMRLWDLRLVRQELAAMGLDWDTPPIPDWPDGEELSTPLKVEVIAGPLRERDDEARWQIGIAQRRLAHDPGNAQAHYERGLGLAALYRFEEARGALDQALTLQPDEPRTLLARARVLEALGLTSDARADEAAARLALVGTGDLTQRLANGLNNRAWGLAIPPTARDIDVRWAVILARQAVWLESDESATQVSLDTLGLTLYRARRYAEAAEVLSRSLALSEGYDAYDLFFLAMARHRLGDAANAREAFDRAQAWMAENNSHETSSYPDELTAFQTEAAQVLGEPADEWPESVFAQ